MTKFQLIHSNLQRLLRESADHHRLMWLSGCLNTCLVCWTTNDDFFSIQACVAMISYVLFCILNLDGSENTPPCFVTSAGGIKTKCTQNNNLQITHNFWTKIHVHKNAKEMYQLPYYQRLLITFYNQSRRFI